MGKEAGLELVHAAGMGPSLKERALFALTGEGPHVRVFQRDCNAEVQPKQAQLKRSRGRALTPRFSASLQTT